MKAGTALTHARRAMRIADTHPTRVAPTAAEALSWAHRERDPMAAAIAERAWGHALLQRGEIAAAIVHLRQSIRHGRKAGSATEAGEARSKLAYALVMNGQARAALAEIDSALRDLPGAAAARARAQRAVILSEIGRLDDALTDFNTALPALRTAGDDLGVARMLVNRGILHAQRHVFGAAMADLYEAERLSQQMGRWLAVGIIAQNLGYVETLRGDVPAALAHLDRAEQVIVKHGGHAASVLYDRSQLLLSVGLAAEARQAADLAVHAFQQAKRLLKVPEARLLQAEAAFVARDWPAAAQHARIAMREFSRQHRAEWAALARLATIRAQMAAGEKVDGRRVGAMVTTLARTGWPAAAVEAHLTAARIAKERGRDALAVTYLRQASQTARGRGPVTLRARGLYAQALLRLHDGDATGAVRAIRSGLKILDEHATSLGATDLRVRSATHRGDLAALGLRVAIADGRAPRLLEWCERNKASRLAHRPARPPNDPRLADLLAQLRQVALETAEANSFDNAARARRQMGLERQIRDHTRLRRGRNATQPTPVTLDALAAALDRRALVEFARVDDTLYGWSLVDGELRTRTVGATEPIADLVRRLPFALHRLAHPKSGRATRTAALALLRQAATRLDDLLLRPFEEISGRELVVVPTGSLHSLPWSVLPSCAGRAVSVSPSATLWHAATTRWTDAGGGVSVIAGPGLPGARAEALEVAAVHGATAILDAAATVQSTIEALATVDLIHLSAHGRLATDNPLFSHLLLADGPLYGYDLEQLRRTPPTVVLAACDSGRPAVYAGDELLGLSATFIALGTAELIASVLPIPDSETAPLMVGFHRRLAHGQPPAMALAATQDELSDGDPTTLAAAAGFVCLGSGRGNGIPPDAASQAARRREPADR